ncbi:MAG: HAD family hydrolase [Planctomycetota bacterium]
MSDSPSVRRADPAQEAPALFVPALGGALRGVLFDLDDTLVDRRAAHARAVQFLLRERLGQVPPHALERFALADDDGLRPRGAFCKQVVRALPELDWTPGELWARYAPAVARAVRPVPGRRDALAALGERVALGVVTNGGPLQREKLRRADLDGLWQSVRVSGEDGCAKPERRLFQLALADLGLEPRDVLYVGDRPHEDIDGARAAGLSTCWIQGPRVARSARADWVVPDVEALFAALLPLAVCCG